MFCNQCQETAGNIGCKVKGVCGKDENTAGLQDTLIYILQGIALYAEGVEKKIDNKYALFICGSLFSTITNANFDEQRISSLIGEALTLRQDLKNKSSAKPVHGSALWSGSKNESFLKEAKDASILNYSDNQDIRSLKELLLYGAKGVAAYAHHAGVLGFYNDDVFTFLIKGLAALAKNLTADEFTALVLECGQAAVKAMALLDKANTSKYGNPEITKVNIGVRNNPGILISGHDLKDMEALLKQTALAGVDVYTHSEMLPANYYPAFKKYKHFAGNYGNSWWKQGEEFESFNGPIIMTTNCITPVKDSYRNRIFTAGIAGYPGVRHIPDAPEGKQKDFSEVIRLAKKCLSPQEIEKGEITGGFAHHQVISLIDKVIEAVKSGSIKRFIVMAGCDGRQPSRKYFTQIAESLPADTIILTAGCAKYRYNKLKLGDINGIPRILDAGQCNDSYSLAVIALKLKEAFKLDDINKLPISFDIAWYEQKAVCVLLALLYLGVKGIRLGPTLPAFLSQNVVKVLVEKFGIKPIGEVKEDVELMAIGR